MTVLVTGGAGYIGSHMVLALLDAGERVVVLDNLTSGFEWAVAKAVRLVVGASAINSASLSLIIEHGVDAVIHFAASIVVPDLGSRIARLLSQQYDELACADRGRNRRGVRLSSFFRPPQSTVIPSGCRYAKKTTCLHPLALSS